MLLTPITLHILMIIYGLIMYNSPQKATYGEDLSVLAAPVYFILHSLGALIISVIIRIISWTIKKPISYIRSVWIGYASIFAVIVFIWFINLFF